MTVYMKGMNGKMDNRPIGMFDSGVGGLTVFKEVKKQLPNENIVYLGDTKRFPYGSKSKESIIELTKQGIEFLIGQNVKLIVIACGTATSQALEEVKKIYSIPIIGIINSTVEYLEHKYRDKEPQIGVIATKGTIRSNGWQNKIELLMPKAKIKTMGCPLLAPMAEEGWTDNKIAELTVKEYLKNIKNVDALILGCTHYPFVRSAIAKVVGQDIDIIDGSLGTSRELMRRLKERDLLNDSMEKGTIEMINSSNKKELIDLCWKLIEM